MEEICPIVEQHSIDEAFIPMRGTLAVTTEEVASTVKQAVYRRACIPVSAGVAPTQTLARVANHMARKSSGVCALRPNAPFRDILSKVPVEGIWGMGRRHAP